MVEGYFEFKTIDNSKVFLKKSDISAFEESPSTSRTESFMKVYVSGYEFRLKISLNDFVAKISGSI